MAPGGLSSKAGATLFAIVIVFIVLAIIAVGLRVWSKNILRRSYRPDDWLAFAALVFAMGFAVNVIIGICPGALGLHITEAEEQLGMGAIVTTEKVFFASNFVWITATTLIKLSLLYLYTGIFVTKPFFYAALGVSILSVVYWVAEILMGFLICRPISAFWTGVGHCGNTLEEEISTATVNMILDLMIVILPLPVLWNLNLPTKKKLMVSSVLSLGLCICAINITRIILEATADSADFTYSSVNAALFASLEVDMGLIVACMPTFGPLFARKKHTLKSRQQNAYTGFRSDRYGDLTKRSATESAFDNDGFERLGDDGIPLRGGSGGGGMPHDGGNSRATAWVDPPRDHSESRSTERTISNGVINVQTDLKVFSTRASQGDADMV